MFLNVDPIAKEGKKALSNTMKVYRETWKSGQPSGYMYRKDRDHTQGGDLTQPRFDRGAASSYALQIITAVLLHSIARRANWFRVRSLALGYGEIRREETIFL